MTLRLLKPECDLDEAWGQEDLDTAVQRTVLLLHNHTVPQRDAKAAGEYKTKFHCKHQKQTVFNVSTAHTHFLFLNRFLLEIKVF